MKKVLSFVLVLTLVLGSFSMAFATTPTDVVGTDCEKAVTALTDLGVVSGYTDGTYQPTKNVNRAEAAKLVVTAIGLGDYASGNTSSFTDLDGYQWATGYIGYAEALGILKGVGDNKFNPGGNVTYQELATMLVRATGYTDASLPGTWPANYVTKAKSLGMMKDIAQAGNVAANRGDVAVMIYNSLEVKLGTVNADNEWVANKDAQGGTTDTMLKRLSRVIYDVDAAANTATKPVSVADDIFVVAGTEKTANSFNLTPYVGAAVVAYADNATNNKITGIREVESTFITGTFDKNTTATATKFYTDDKVTYKLNGATFHDNYFFNGATTTTASKR